jgi:hypothetical protein
MTQGELKLLQKILTSLLSATAIGADGFARAESVDDSTEWLRSRSYLSEPRPEEPKQSYPMADMLRGVLLRAIQHPDHAREIANLHSQLGTRSVATSKSFLSPMTPETKSHDGADVRVAMSNTFRTFVQKETKVNVLPPELQQGLRFSNEGSGSAGSAADAGPRYGLILTNIEPNPASLKLAAVNTFNDIELLQYAAKAELHYEVGPVYPESGPRSYAISVPSSTPVETPWWSALPDLPSYKFRGRLVPKGLPSPSSPLPPHVLSLEQSQGFYSLEAQLENGISPQSMVHRLRVPIYGNLRYLEERDKKLKPVKSVFENLYSSGSFACNLEHYHLEKRYQAGFIYRRPALNLEIYAHIPKAALHDDFWPNHRWELKLERFF